MLALALGFTALLLPSGDHGAWITIVRWLLPGVAVLMALGSLRYLGQRHAALRAHPPPGRRVDLGAWNFVGHPCSLPFIGSPFEQPEEEIRAVPQY